MCSTAAALLVRLRAIGPVQYATRTRRDAPRRYSPAPSAPRTPSRHGPVPRQGHAGTRHALPVSLGPEAAMSLARAGSLREQSALPISEAWARLPARHEKDETMTDLEDRLRRELRQLSERARIGMI